MLVFHSLDAAAVEKLFAHAEKIEGKKLPLDAEARAVLVRMADGDGRAALTLAEEVWRAARKDEMFNAAQLQDILQRRAPIYDKSADGHYNLISALHKSVRGSDPDAALYYLARMLDAGEDPLFLARRVVRMAVEDIGLADPQALVICNAAKDAYRFPRPSRRRTRDRAGRDLFRHRAEIQCRLRRLWRRDARGKGGRFAVAAKAHSEFADQADEVGRLWLAATNTTTTRPMHFPARIISRKSWAARPFTIRPIAASSARSENGWITGPSCGGSGAGDGTNEWLAAMLAAFLRRWFGRGAFLAAGFGHSALAETVEVAPGIQVTKRTYSAPVNEQPFFGFAVKTDAQREADEKFVKALLDATGTREKA